MDGRQAAAGRRGAQGLVSGPRSAARIADMDDPRVSALDAPIDEIRITAGRQDSDAFVPGKAAAFRVVADQFEGFLDRPLDVSGALRTSPVEIVEIVTKSSRARGA